MTEGAGPDRGLEMAALTDVGTEREHNEDACGTLIEGPACFVLAVADGVSGNQGGDGTQG